MKKTSLACLALALAAPIALVGCSSGGSSSELTSMSFQSRFNDRQLVDTGEQGSSIGDAVNGHGDLLDESGQVIGQFDVSTQTTRTMEGAEVRMVTAEYEFGDGTDSFIIQGAEHFETAGGLPALDRPLHYAVVGGTGTYMGANGECLVHRRQPAYTVECTFALLKR